MSHSPNGKELAFDRRYEHLPRETARLMMTFLGIQNDSEIKYWSQLKLAAVGYKYYSYDGKRETDLLIHQADCLLRQHLDITTGRTDLDRAEVKWFTELSMWATTIEETLETDFYEGKKS